MAAGGRMILEGVRVVELAQWGFGPRAGVHLADLGAEVVKIEHPVGGDPFRAWNVLQGRRLPPSPVHFAYEVFNRNKRSIALDVGVPEGKQVVRLLVERADVFITTFRPRVLERLGYNYENVSAIKPRIIYAQGTGWGIKGKWRDRAAFGPAIWAASGVASIMGDPGTPPPQAPPAANDLLGGISLAFGILAALYHRERTGQGQMVHTSLLATALDFSAYLVQAQLLHDGEIPRIDRQRVANPLFNIYRTRDGRWLQLLNPQFDRYWPEVCNALGLGHLQGDPRFRFEALERDRNNEALISILDEVIGSRTLREWEEALSDRFDFAWAPVSTFAEVVRNPQVVDNELITEYAHPAAGKVRGLAPPVQFSKAPAHVSRPAPECGQHTEEVLLELGYSWEDIKRLKEKKVIL